MSNISALPGAFHPRCEKKVIFMEVSSVFNIRKLVFLSILVNILLSEVYGQGNLKEAVRSSTSSTWLSANGTCKLADSRSTRFPPGSDGTEAWVGAYIGYTSWVHLVGCHRVRSSELSTWTRTSNSPNTLGRCMEFCQNHSLYALNMTHCFCAPSGALPILFGRCNIGICPGTSDFCGINSGFTNVLTSAMFYRQDTMLSLDNTPGKLCTSVRQHYSADGQVIYERMIQSCDAKLGFYSCKNDQGVHSLIQSSTNVTWAEAALLCSARGEVLSDAYTFPRLLSSAFESGCEFWVGIVRREIVTWNTDLPQSNTNNVAYQCRTAEPTTDGQVIHRSKDCATSMPAWCETRDSMVYSTLPVSSILPGQLVRNSTQPSVRTAPLTSEETITTSTIVAIVMFFLVTTIIVVAVIMYRKKMKRRIYIGSPNLEFIPADAFEIATANSPYQVTKFKIKDPESDVKEISGNTPAKSICPVSKALQKQNKVTDPYSVVSKARKKSPTCQTDEAKYDSTREKKSHDASSGNTYGGPASSEQYDTLRGNFEKSTTTLNNDLDYDHMEPPEYSHTEAKR